MERKQILEIYGLKIVLTELPLCEVQVHIAGGCLPDGDDSRDFPSYAKALEFVAELAAELEDLEEEGELGELHQRLADRRSHDLADVCPGESR